MADNPAVIELWEVGMRRVRVAGIALGWAVALAWPLLLADPAAAQVTGPCTASLSGRSAASIATPETALEVHEDGQLVAEGTMSRGPVVWQIDLSFGTPAGDRSWTAKRGRSDGATWSGTVNVKEYARYSVGLYRINAISSNGTEQCSALGFIKVVGGGGLSPVGIAGAAGVGLGMAAVAVAGARAAGETSMMAKRITADAVGTGVVDFLEDQSDLSPEERQRRQEQRDREREADVARRNIVEGIERSRDFGDFVSRPLIAFAFCCTAALFAGAATLVVMMVDGMKSLVMVTPVAMVGAKLRWKPRISFVSLVGGLLAGLGLIVLTQQLGVVYPTQITSSVMLLGGLIVGVVVPLAGRTIAVRRVNRALARVSETVGGPGSRTREG